MSQGKVCCRRVRKSNAEDWDAVCYLSMFRGSILPSPCTYIECYLYTAYSGVLMLRPMLSCTRSLTASCSTSLIQGTSLTRVEAWLVDQGNRNNRGILSRTRACKLHRQQVQLQLYQRAVHMDMDVKNLWPGSILPSHSPLFRVLFEPDRLDLNESCGILRIEILQRIH